MPSSNDCWGIEVGANAIKAIRLQKTGSDLVVTDYDVLPFKKVLTTPDLDVDEAIRINLDQFLARHSIGKASVVVSVPGNMAFARFAKLPPVEPKRVPDIVKFEAVQQIPFPIDTVEWDYQIFQQPDSPDVEVGIFAITKDRVLNWLSNFHAVGLPVQGLTLSPLAVYNAMAHDMQMDEAEPGTIFMDIGTSATDLIVVESGRIWLRTIPIGGTHFTEALVRSFKLSHSKAEKIKREAATSKYARQIFQAMRPVFVDLVGEVQKSLGFYQSLNRDAQLERLIGLGSTFRLPGLQKFLKQQLQLDVVKLDTFKRIEVEGRNAASFAEHTLEMSTAYGLALQGLELEKVSANILPTTMIRQQVWKAKQPYMVAAAAIIALSAGVGYTRLWLDRQAYESNQGLRSEISQVMSQAESLTTNWKSIEGGSDPRSRIENLRRILDYRTVTPMLLADIQGAIAAADPQEELLSGDPETIKSITRSERRQIRVEQILTEYQYQGAAGNPNSPWGERAMLQASGMYDGYGGYNDPAMGGAAPTTGQTTTGTTGTEKQLPSIVVTIIGTTPKDQAPAFLNDTFVTYLIEREKAMQKMDELHKENPTEHPPRPRPYRTSRDERNQYAVKILDIVPLASTLDQNTQSSNRPKARTQPAVSGRTIPGAIPGAVPGGIPGARGIPGSFPGDPYGEGMYGEFPGAPGSGSSAQTKLQIADLMPSDPLAEEDRAGDWRFVIQWRVELTRPEDARQTGWVEPQVDIELPAEASVAAPSQTAEAAASSTEQPAAAPADSSKSPAAPAPADSTTPPAAVPAEPTRPTADAEVNQ